MEWDKRAFIITSGVCTLVLFLLLMFGFTTPLPLPAEEGILINFGDDQTGFGSVEPRPVEKVVKQPDVSDPVPTVQTPEPTQMTQDYEEAPTIQVKKKVAETPKKKTETKKKPEEKPKEEPKKVVDSRALWGRNRNTQSTGSEGVSGGAGNQGDPSGDENAKSHSLGSGVGNGISFSLNGRAAVKLSPPKSDHQKEGTVVVQIKVDRNGKVISAVPIAKGSTTLDSYLQGIAKRAALASSFNRKDDAPAMQVGTITYVFRLK